MKRRTFLGSAAAGVGGLSIVTSATAASSKKVKKGAFKDAPLKFSLPPGWFKGELPEKLDQIAELGVPGFEILGPGGDIDKLAKDSKDRGLQLSCIGGAGRIAPGHMVLPSDHDNVVKMFRERVVMANKLGVKVLIGLSGNTRDDASAEEQTDAMVTCLKRLVPIAEEHDVTIVMEALNVLVNHAGYFLTRTDQTMAVLDAVGSPRVKMCFDVYHQQITEGNIIRNLTENIERVGHIHIEQDGRQSAVLDIVRDEWREPGKFDIHR